MKTMNQARLADAGLADNQRHLSFALQRTCPTIIKQTQFVLTADEWSQSADCGASFEPTAHATWPNYLVKLERSFDAL
jgi:hypothetical protein